VWAAAKSKYDGSQHFDYTFEVQCAYLP
jgi:hypothetical protein